MTHEPKAVKPEGDRGEFVKRAVIYARISRDPEHNELGVRRQEADCRALCERDGLEVAEVVVDDDRSAYKGKKRPGYERVVQLVQTGEVQVLVAWHPDRITRSPKELEALIDLLEAAKCTVRTVQAGEYDLSTPSGRMTARVVGAVARGESEHKSARLRRKHLELAERGKVSGGGTRPFGFKADRRTVEPTEAKLIVEGVQRIIAGGTLRGIAADWNRRGIATPTGRTWQPAPLIRLFTSPRIAGLRQHSSGTYKAEWPAIISADDHRRVVAILKDPKRRTSPTNARSYLLSGFLFCGLCGKKLIARPRGDKRRCYVCSSGPGIEGCGKIRTLADPIEDLIIEAVLTRFDGSELSELVDRLPDPDEDGPAQELQRVEEQLEELAAMWAGGELDRISWAAARKPLEASAARLNVEMQRSAVTAPVAKAHGDLRAVWPELDFDQKRSVIGELVEKVTARSALKGRNRFDPTRFDVVWRI